MCGFAGYFSFGNQPENAKDLLIKMGDSIVHRGPDDAGIHIEEQCGFSHRRLSILDLSDAGQQPMCNENKSIWLVYNGEIYNFRELRKLHNLDSKGHTFSTKTDTEVIIHLYEEFDEQCVEKLNGMFAFALWDRDKRKLHLARDQYGIKPLFYMRTAKTFWFASEIKALLQVPEYKTQICLESAFHYFSLGYIPGELTAFEGIRELPAGHMLTICKSNHKMDIKQFKKESNRSPINISDKDAIEQSYELLKNSVQRQIFADVPVGVMLSGGMDSSSLVSLMAEVLTVPDFHTFSIGFDDSSFDESKYAKIVANEIKTKHHHIPVTAQQVVDLLPKYLAYIDEPYADGSAIPTYLLSKYASQFVKVLLSGEGGDEFFSGYDTHAAFKATMLYRMIPKGIRRKIIYPIVNALPVSHKKLSFDFKAKRFVRGVELNIPRAHFFWRVIFTEDAKKELFKNVDLISAFPRTDYYFETAFDNNKQEDIFNKLLAIDSTFHLPDDLMIKNDRMTMAHSIEARVPFTDNDLVLFLQSLPGNSKMKGYKKKYLLRKAMKNRLPPSITKRKKVGLEMPYSNWLLNDMREIAEDCFSSTTINDIGILNAQKVKNVWESHKRRTVDNGRPLWAILNYVLWHKNYITSKNYLKYLHANHTGENRNVFRRYKEHYSIKQ